MIITEHLALGKRFIQKVPINCNLIGGRQVVSICAKVIWHGVEVADSMFNTARRDNAARKFLLKTL
jgi:hypothetical protein